MTRFTAMIAAALLAVGGAAQAETVTADIIGTKGDKIGTLSVADAPTGVVLTVEIGPGGLAPGWHGNHLHAVGDCSDVGTFKKSTGHINPSGRKHGLLNPDGPDNADLPNLYVHADGSAHAQMFNPRVSLKGSVPLLDDDGSAFIIHANPDDHMAQPIGGAGGRVACAAIK
ncbi:MAG: superoxide dismutase family protein [Alphaproteobacteria bacterium]